MRIAIYAKCECGKIISVNSPRCKSCSNKNRTGFKMTDIARKNISNSKKGIPSWNKGKTLKDDPRIAHYVSKIQYKNPLRIEKIRQSKLGKKRVFSELWRKNLSLANIKIGKFKGANNPFWAGGIPNKGYISRHHEISSVDWKILRYKVIQRDGLVCNICKTKPSPPCIDHILPYRYFKDNSVENLQVLCRSCHAKKDMGWAQLK